MAKAEAARIGGALGTALLAIILQRTIAAGLPASTGASRRSPRCRNNSWRPQRQRSPAPSTPASGSAIRLIAAALSSSAADVRGTMVSPGDLFALDLTAYWSWSIHEQEQVGGSWLRQLAGQRRRARSSPTCNAGTCTLKVGWSPRRLHRKAPTATGTTPLTPRPPSSVGWAEQLGPVDLVAVAGGGEPVPLANLSLNGGARR